uniref:Short/branched chain specific acyl-CoA dehydrogenase, mitochondrial n=1 Tax=Ceratitis capitata TaxID=7213 RepID=W8BUU3_CERCA
MNCLRKIPMRMIVNGVQRQQQCMPSSTGAMSALTVLTEDERVMKETVAKLAQEQIAPLVKKMDEEHKFDPSVVKAVFENGLMGIEVDPDLGGSGCNFLTTILAVEELSKVDPAVGAFVDIHNTLVVSLMMKVGSEEQKNKYLPKLSQEYVSK